MDKKIFREKMEILAGAYRDPRYISDQVLKTWYEFFKDTPPERLEEAIREWVTSEANAPAIANIKDECLKIRLKEAGCV